MAKEHTIRIRLEGDSREVEQSILGVQRRLGELDKESEKLRRQWDRGEISAKEFREGLDKVEKEANQLKAALEDAGASTKSIASRFGTAAASIKANAIKIAAAIAGLVVAFRQLQEAANLRGQTVALKRAVEAQGVEYNAWIAKIKEVSDAQLDMATIVDVSANAIARGIEAARIPELLEVARAKSIETGRDMTEVFEALGFGIARQSEMIIENAAIIIKVGEAYEAYAKKIGVTTKELTNQQKTTAVLEATIAAGQDSIKRFGDAQDEMARRLSQASAQMKDLKTNALNLATGLIQMTTGGGAAVVIMLSLIAEGIVKVVKGWALLGSVIPGVGESFKGMADKIQEVDDGLDAFQKKTAQFALDVSKGGAALVKLSVGMEENIQVTGKLTDAVNAHADAEQRRQALLKAEEEAYKSINAVAQEYGITLKADIQKAIDDNNKALEAAEEALKRNIISEKEYGEITKAVTEDTKKLTNELQGIVPASERLEARLQHLRELNKSLGESAREAGTDVEGFSDNLDSAADSATRAASAIDDVTEATERWQTIEAGERTRETIGRDPRVGGDPWRHLVGGGGVVRGQRAQIHRHA